MKNTLKHIIYGVLLTAVILYLTGFVLLRTPAAQTFIAHNIEKALSEKIGSRVHVGSVDVRLPNRVVVDDVEICDQKGKTMLRASRVSAAVNLLQLLDGKVSLSSAQLFGAGIYLYQENADAPLNCQFAVDSLSSKDNEPSALDLHISSLIIRNCSLKYDRLDIPKVSGVFSTNHVDISQLRANISIDKFVGDDVVAEVGRLSFREASGLNCRNLACELNLDKHDGRQSVRVRNFNLVMPDTDIKSTETTLSFISDEKGIDKNSLILSTDLMADAISAKDFAPLLKLRNVDKLPKLRLKTSLNIKDAKLKSGVLIESKDSKDLVADLVLRGNNIFTNVTGGVSVNKLHVSENFVKQLTEICDVPSQLLGLGTIDADADIVMHGTAHYDVNTTVKTQKAGDVALQLNYNEVGGKKLVDADVRTDGMDLTHIVGNGIIGNVKGHIAVSGELSKDMIPSNVKLKGDVAQITVDNQVYENISIDGKYIGEAIVGKVSVNNSLLRFETDIDAKMKNRSIDNLEGQIDINDLYVAQYGIGVNNITLSAASDGAERRYDLNTDFANITLQGKITLSSLPQSFTHLLTHYLPYAVSQQKHTVTDNDYRIEAKVHNLDFLKKISDMPLELSQPITIAGRVKDDERFIDMEVFAPGLGIFEKNLKNTHLHLFTPNKSLLAALTTQLETSDSPVNLTVDCKASDNKLIGSVAWNNQRENLFRGKINTETRFYHSVDGSSMFNVSIPYSDFEIGDTIWNISANDINYAGNRLTIDNLSIGNNNQHVYINGIASKSENDTLAVALKDIDVSYILDLVNFHSVEFSGNATGKVTACSVMRELDANANLQVADFKFEGGDMGTLYVDASYSSTTQQIDLEAMADDKEAKGLTLITGYISPGKNSIDLNIEAENTRLDFMRSFCGSFLNDIDLHGDGEVRLYGPFSALELTGEIVANGYATVTSTQCRYELVSDTVRLVPDDIQFNRAMIKDKYGNEAYVSGGIHHSHLGRMSYDVNVETDKMLAYDINSLDNSTFCGKAMIGGDVSINGKGNELLITARAKTLPGSYITYNTASPDAIATKEFITWGSMNERENDTTEVALVSDEQIVNAGNDRTNIRMRFNVSVTPDARLNLLMDAVTGDYIDLYGNGELQISYYNKGSLQIFGNYNVDRGDYRMTIQNVLRRDFVFQNGSVISFGGDPFEATLAMKAAYKLNSVSLADLNIGTSFKTNNVPVNCLMNITGIAGQPKVDFDLDLPTLDTDAKQMVHALINSEESMNQQVLYLLAIGRFYSTANNTNMEGEYTGQTALAMQSFLSGTFSQQLNQVLNSLTNNDNWTFGANIATGTDGLSNAEYEGLLSGRMFNNRLLFNGQFGYRDNIVKNSQSFIGDFSIQYLLVPNGNISVKMYNQSNDRYFTRNSLNTQGVGIMFKKEFGK